MLEPRARLEAAVLPHLDAGYNLARWLCCDPDLAQDIVQEATLRALRFLAGYRGEDARPWYPRIVRNTLNSGHARMGRAEVIPFSVLESEDGGALFERTAAPGDDPETALARLQEQGCRTS